MLSYASNTVLNRPTMRQKISQIIFLFFCIIEAIASDNRLCNRSSKTNHSNVHNVSVEDKCVLCLDKSCDKGGDYDEFFQTSRHHQFAISYISIPKISKQSICYFCISHFNASLNKFVLDDTVFLIYNNRSDKEYKKKTFIKSESGKWETNLDKPKRNRYRVQINSGMPFYYIYLFIC